MSQRARNLGALIRSSVVPASEKRHSAATRALLSFYAVPPKLLQYLDASLRFQAVPKTFFLAGNALTFTSFFSFFVVAIFSLLL